MIRLVCSLVAGAWIYFSSDLADKGWDGKFNGTLQGASTFVWMAAGIDYTGRLIERRGTVILIR